MNGKVMQVPSDMTTIRVAHRDSSNYLSDIEARMEIDLSPVNYETYSMRLMSSNIGNRQYIAPAIHPDGSVYFEWDKPRGSRRRD